MGRGQGDWLDRGNRPKKTGETVDRRQNNGSVKAVSPRHCPATCAPCNCSFNCCAGQSLWAGKDAGIYRQTGEKGLLLTDSSSL